jgi:hypothetical protein
MPEVGDDENEKKEEEEEDESEGIDNNSIGCNVAASDKMFEGPTGKKFRISCPSMCTMKFGVVVGTMIYSDNSFVCAAAVHAGFLEREKGGEAILVIANG